MLFGGGLVERGEFFKPLRQFCASFGKCFFIAPNIGVDLVVLKICCGFTVEQRGEVSLVQGLGYFGGFGIVDPAGVLARFFVLPQDVANHGFAQRVCRVGIVRAFAGQDEMQRVP